MKPSANSQPTSSDETPKPFACRTCRSAGAFKGERNRMPAACPTLTHPQIADDETSYLEPDRLDLMRVADASPFTEEREMRSRVEELIFFAHRRNHKRIGVAFCVSMLKEAQELGRRLEASGIEAELVCCRVGAIDYDRIGLEKAHPERFAAICNPVAQARLLNERHVDLVAQMGLCLGHDLILQEESKAPVTTLVVKDRRHSNNPLEALRSS